MSEYERRLAIEMWDKRPDVPELSARILADLRDGNLVNANDGGTDDASAIEARLRDLIAYNELERAFEIGRDYGRLVVGIDGYCKTFAPSSFMDRVFRPLGRLSEAPEIKHSAVAASSLQSVFDCFEEEFAALIEVMKDLVDRHAETPSHPSSKSDIRERIRADAAGRRARTLERINVARMALWVSFGELMGFFRCADENSDAGPNWKTTREDRLKGIDSVDKVRATLPLVEQELSQPSCRAEVVIITLANSIEALSRRIWPADFRYQTLGYILADKCRLDPSRHRHEFRFASAALSLYKSYRNPVCHDFDNFACSYIEAQYFVSAIRMLLELCDNLIRRG
jgi:hypothetical protein